MFNRNDGAHGTVVIDIGTGYTKLGLGGHLKPTFVFPTAVGTLLDNGTGTDMDFYIGQDAVQRVPYYTITSPLKQGVVTDWSHFEKIIYGCLCTHMRLDTKEHPVLLTEPPLNPVENRESMAEIMFETFQIPHLHIGMQAVLALYGLRGVAGPAMNIWRNEQGVQADSRMLSGLPSTLADLTGTVIDSGDGATHVIPVVNGYVVGRSIRSIPLAGSNITAFLQSLMRDRGEDLPIESSLEVCRSLKEKYCYTCRDMATEFEKMESDPVRHIKPHRGVHRKNGQPFLVDVAYERFLAPEVFFQPEIAGLRLQGLPELVDDAVQSCSIDSRRQLYNNVFLSGGSTLFRNFDKRLQLEIQTLVDGRLQSESTGLPVQVHGHHMQRYAVWFGGSLLSTTDSFLNHCHSKAQYDEYGPSICRANLMFPEDR